MYLCKLKIAILKIMIEVKIQDAVLQQAAEAGMDEFVKAFVDAIREAIGGELTAETIVDGYVRTKDLAYLDEDGDCILVGRADDVINYGGSKISPAEIEDLALGYEHIDDVAYTSIKDPITGELPVILVVQKDGYEEADFESFLADRLESYKLPRKYIYVESIPKTFKGSVLRKEVRKLAEQNV